MRASRACQRADPGGMTSWVPRGAVIFEAMNPILSACAALTALALPHETVREVLATASGTLFESTPFILAATLLQRLARGRAPWLVPLLGCGCGGGPAARSLPAAAALWPLFGPWVAIGRWAAAMAAGAMLARRTGHGCAHEEPLAILSGLVPYALLAGVAGHVLALAGTALPVGAAGWAVGAGLGFALAPCALGVAGLAGALRGVSPACAAGLLTVAGIADLRALAPTHAHGRGADGGAYALCAVACALAAWRGGATLVHPRFGPALWACAIALGAAAWAYRGRRESRAWAAPAMMCAALVLGAPAPSYRATATTLADAFAGEPLAFTGLVVRDGRSVALVRYAITCCRADAAPVAVRLDRDVAVPDGAWLSVAGTLVAVGAELRLHPSRLTRIDAPRDPFLYR